jgi:ATP-binding cassette subfamily F protein 3
LLLQGADATLLPGQKIALTGSNGCGKSTLFALLLGELSADQGDLEGLSGQRIAHMAQDIAASEQSAVDFVLGGDAPVAELLTRLQSEEARGDFEAAALTHQALETCDAYTAPRRARRLLSGLGFTDADGDRPLSDFSGGWRVRLALARALMTPSDLLLLDEPTNHLDLDTSLWLQSFLSAYEGTLLLISHDRDFIDATCSAVLHIEQERLNSYRGGYTDFERQRALRIAEQRAASEKQALRRAEIEDFVRRFRAKATKAKQAQSRLKELARMGEAAIAYSDSPFEFKFPAPPRARDPLLELREAALGYADVPVLKHLDLALRSGDRIALLGRNGAGKTTLLRGLTGELVLLGGSRHASEGCRIAYFDQQQVDTLDLEASALLHLQRLSPEVREQELRDFLGGFDFRGKRADASLLPFSGGEKARLALALVVWQRPNVLILDEPTNHLDLEMRRALELALIGFEGAVVLVSHDRHLLRSTANTLYRVADGALQEYDGDLERYESELLRGADKGLEDEQDSRPASGTGTADRREQRRAAADARERRRPLERALQAVEKQIDAQHKALATLNETLADLALYEASEKARLSSTLEEQGERRRTLETLEQDWFNRQEALDDLPSE